MNIRKIAAVAASALTITAVAVGSTTPASAQGYHHSYGPGYHRGYAPGYNHFRGTVYPYPNYVAPIYRTGPRYYYRRPAVTYWSPGPGYVRHSLAWYNSQPGYWRAEHSYRYHNSPALGIWVRL